MENQKNKNFWQPFFNPSAVAIIGASKKSSAVGSKVFNNIWKNGFSGKIYPVNPKYKKIQKHTVFSNINDISDFIDLAVIVTPTKTVLNILEECGQKKVKAVIILSSGFSETGKAGKKLEQSILSIAQKYHIRLIGPNCLGMMRPAIKLNATFDNNFPLAGNIALVSQSGAICAAILDWAVERQIGFSVMISLGNALDLDFDEILDFLSSDPKTKSILLYIEGIHHSQRFIKSLQAAAKVKPVILIKGGRDSQGLRAAHTHTGVLVGDDDVFDAALRQAGAVRVMTIKQLFSAAEILSSNYRAPGNRLVIITNGGGAGVMAADRASELNITLPRLNKKTTQALNQVLPPTWSHQNPIDIIGDATPERYHDTLNICLQDKNIDGLLTILVPVAMSNPRKVAEQIIKDSKEKNKPILACWMGGKHIVSSRKLFTKNNIPYFNTPEEAVEAFSYLADYQHNQKLLKEFSKSLSKLHKKPDFKKASSILTAAKLDSRLLKSNQITLTATQSKAFLKSCGILTTQSTEAPSANEAIKAAKKLTFPVVMKINSPDISHKKEANGVKLNIQNEKEVAKAFQQLLSDATHFFPKAKILGVTVEKMSNNKNNRELMVGVIRDKVFGPVITFGMGGTLVEVIRDRAVALPPLNTFLARHLINQTRAAKLLGEFRGMLPINMEALINILICISQIVTEIPDIQEMDINPLIVNEKEAIALDARIVISAALS